MTTGYQNYFGDDILVQLFPGANTILDTPSAGFIPIAAAGRYSIFEKFTLGADIGYAIGVTPEGNDGGFYYAPRAQMNIVNRVDIVFAYRGISIDGGNFNALTLGFEFRF